VKIEMGTQPSYYAILPAHVRYDKELTAQAKLLYAEITALAEANGYCWASNNYFAELYGVDIRTIKRTISQLASKDYLHVEVDRDAGNSRKIYVGILVKKEVQTANYPRDKNVTRSGQKCHEGSDKNVPTPRDKNVPIILQDINTTRLTVSKKESKEKNVRAGARNPYERESYEDILNRLGFVGEYQKIWFKYIQFLQLNKTIVTNEQLERIVRSILSDAKNAICDSYGYKLFLEPDLLAHADEINDFVARSIEQALRGKHKELKAPKGWMTTKDSEQQAIDDMERAGI
jgi:DNA-binding MarR family transcriptional regulator